MCSIAGIVSQRALSNKAEQLIASMNEVQSHRGPDGKGVWLGDGVVFGHRRLAIIDLSRKGSQPMTNEDGSIVIVAAGEIYNYQDLMLDLKRRGHIFRSRTDIEVILHLYEEYSDDCVQHLVGMFAFGLWDGNRGSLLLARDRIGEKPLYYSCMDGQICFATEIKALLQIPGVNRELDHEAISSLLIYCSSPAPLTFFQGIRSLPPASRLVWSGGKISVERYWTLNFSDSQRNWTREDAVDEYEARLAQSVKGCMIADVPVGIMLSGGVDSSSIAVHAVRSQKELLTFCLGQDPAENSDPELERATRVAELLGCKHENIPFRPTDVTELATLVYKYDQPFNVYPMIYANRLAEEISRKVKVVLGGNGADELFGGYWGYNTNIGLGRLMDIMTLVPESALKALNSITSRDLNKYKVASSLPIEERRGYLLDCGKEKLAQLLFFPEYLSTSKQYLPGKFVTDYSRECSPRDYLDTLMYSDLMVYHQHSTTIISDVSGMNFGLEIRSPFLDHRLVEFAASLPRRMKIPYFFNSKLNKRIMKQSLARHLPREVVYARKMGFGFGIDLAKLLKGVWADVVDAFVIKGRYLELGIFSPSGARWAVNNSPAHTWMLLVFSIWADFYIFRETIENVTTRINQSMHKKSHR